MAKPWPVLAKSACALDCRSSTCAGVSIPAWSTTGEPLFCGNVCADAGAASANSASSSAARRCFTSARVEVHVRRGLRPGRGLERDFRLGAVEDLRADRRREGADERVILLHRRVVIAARGVDPVLRALKLVLEREEVGIGLEVRIGLLEPLKRDDRVRQARLRI